jgi:hypothetical protein
MIRAFGHTESLGEATEIPAQGDPQPFKPLGRPVARAEYDL